MGPPVSSKPGPQNNEVFSGGGALAMLSAVLSTRPSDAWRWFKGLLNQKFGTRHVRDRVGVG
jgi:hypothetical protein